MKHTDLARSGCPIARSLSHVGEWWSILIVRDALAGISRFDEFQRSLGIAPNMLTRRLRSMEASGLLERRLYSDRPPRYEYQLTEQGRDLRPVVQTLLAWGNRHLAPEGASLLIINSETGVPADPVVVDRHTGRSLTDPVFVEVPGPAANERVKKRYPNRIELL